MVLSRWCVPNSSITHHHPMWLLSSHLHSALTGGAVDFRGRQRERPGHPRRHAPPQSGRSQQSPGNLPIAIPFLIAHNHPLSSPCVRSAYPHPSKAWSSHRCAKHKPAHATAHSGQAWPQRHHPRSSRYAPRTPRLFGARLPTSSPSLRGVCATGPDAGAEASVWDARGRRPLDQLAPSVHPATRKLLADRTSASQAPPPTSAAAADDGAGDDESTFNIW